LRQGTLVRRGQCFPRTIHIVSRFLSKLQKLNVCGLYNLDRFVNDRFVYLFCVEQRQAHVKRVVECVFRVEPLTSSVKTNEKQNKNKTKTKRSTDLLCCLCFFLQKFQQFDGDTRFLSAPKRHQLAPFNYNLTSLALASAYSTSRQISLLLTKPHLHRSILSLIIQSN